MTPIEKVNELVKTYSIFTNGYSGSSMLSNFEFPDVHLERTVTLTTKIVDEIIDAFISGGRDSFELQNMDKEFRFWYEVKDELNRMKS